MRHGQTLLCSVGGTRAAAQASMWWGICEAVVCLVKRRRELTAPAASVWIIARIGAGEAVQREQRRQLSFSDELLYQSARKRRSQQAERQNLQS